MLRNPSRNCLHRGCVNKADPSRKLCGMHMREGHLLYTAGMAFPDRALPRRPEFSYDNTVFGQMSGGLQTESFETSAESLGPLLMNMDSGCQPPSDFSHGSPASVEQASQGPKQHNIFRVSPEELTSHLQPVPLENTFQEENNHLESGFYSSDWISSVLADSDRSRMCL